MSLYKQIGNRIRQSREALGYSQEELGRHLGYSATAIYYFENGDRKVRIDDLKKLSEIFGKPISYFLQEEPEDELVAILWRAEQELSPIALNQLSGLIQKVSVEKPSKPTLKVDFSGLKPYAAAERMLERTDAQEPPVNLEKIAEKLGISICPTEFINDVSAVLVQAPKFTAIGVNKDHHPNRQRFSIAHELGHVVMGHTDRLFIEFTAPELVQDQTPQRVDQEREANWFAADLLMPAAKVKEDWRRFKGGVAVMAKHYEVSEQAMWIRLQHFQLAPLQDTEFTS